MSLFTTRSADSDYRRGSRGASRPNSARSSRPARVTYGMARPLNADSRETQERIVAAARALLEEGGPAAVSVRRVAESANLSAGTVRYYFATQEDLLVEACINDYYDQLDQLKVAFFSQLKDRQGAAQAVRVSVSTVYRYCLTTEVAHHLLIGRGAKVGRVGDDREAQSRVPFLREFSQRLAAVTDRSERELRFAAQSLMFMIPRYAALGERQLLDVFGEGRLEDAHSAAEAHIIATALHLLGLEAADD